MMGVKDSVATWYNLLVLLSILGKTDSDNACVVIDQAAPSPSSHDLPLNELCDDKQVSIELIQTVRKKVRSLENVKIKIVIESPWPFVTMLRNNVSFVEWFSRMNDAFSLHKRILIPKEDLAQRVVTKVLEQRMIPVLHEFTRFLWENLWVISMYALYIRALYVFLLLSSD